MNFIRLLMISMSILAFAFVLSACSPQTETGVTETTMEPASDTADETSASENSGGKTLVVYFSATGNTKAAAEKIAEAVNGDLFEIVPANPYTAEDLNYNDSSSRVSAENNDSTIRPEINGAVENLADYDTVYLGYPIWWGHAPNILFTFVESTDLSGKTVIPFCTSASSGIGSSAESLSKSASAASNWSEGHRFSSSASDSDIAQWLESIN